MEYKGKLYGRLGGKMYFDTGKTADDWDAIEKRVAELEAENQALRQPPVSGSLPSLMNIYMNANSMKYQDFVEWIRNYGNDR